MMKNPLNLETLTQVAGTPRPVMLAPLAGVSDYPFRVVCGEMGADLTYVEMLSSTALIYGNQKTLEMLSRHPSEVRLGVQLTGRNPEEVAQAVGLLQKYPFETIDINMGCPVKKVVAAGCGSAILRDPQRVLRTVRLAKDATDRPLSAKIRLGWTKSEQNYLEVGQAAEEGGVDWLCLHGRTRADTYADPVDLAAIAGLKRQSRVPVIANGNLFDQANLQQVGKVTGADGLMVSRGALGNPWVFAKGGEGGKGERLPTPEEWGTLVQKHLRLQREAYGEEGRAIVCMRKHLGWYLKGWPASRDHRERATSLISISQAMLFIDEFVSQLQMAGVQRRYPVSRDWGQDFSWDPKYDMDRAYDRDHQFDAEGGLEPSLGLQSRA